ncbi:RNA pseudouridine synthase [Cooperia oncophora]
MKAYHSAGTMSDRSAADDFFGIEYMSSQSPKAEPKEEEKEPDIAVKDKPKRSFRLRTIESAFEKDPSRLSGTEFLDRAFFPQLELVLRTLMNHQKMAVSRPKTSSKEQYFGRVGSATKETIRAPSEAEESVPQLVELDGNTDNRRRSLTRNPQNDSGHFQFDVSSDDSARESGLDKIRADIIPLWRMTQEELVELMINRVLYKDDDIVALDKPYGMAYSGASQNSPQLDRLLQKIKASVVPKCERLYLVRSLDKFQSGIVLFATNATAQSALKEDFEKGMVEQISRCIVRGELNDSPLKINIPLLKTVKDRDMKLVPLVSNKAKGDIFYVESECRTIRGNQYVFECGSPNSQRNPTSDPCSSRTGWMSFNWRCKVRKLFTATSTIVASCSGSTQRDRFAVSQDSDVSSFERD